MKNVISITQSHQHMSKVNQEQIRPFSLNGMAE